MITTDNLWLGLGLEIRLARFSGSKEKFPECGNILEMFYLADRGR